MPTDARAATALSSPGPYRFALPSAEPALLSEQDRFVLDVFRMLRLFRERYDEAWLARAEALAERRLGSQADALMGAAVMLDNELRCRGVTAFASGRPGDARADGEEALFLSFLDAAAERAEAVAARTAAALGVDDPRFLVCTAARFIEIVARADALPARASAYPLRTNVSTAKLPSRTMFE